MVKQQRLKAFMNKEQLERDCINGSPIWDHSLLLYVVKMQSTDLNIKWVDKYINESENIKNAWTELTIGSFLIRYFLLESSFGNISSYMPFGIIFQNSSVVGVISGLDDVYSQYAEVVNFLKEELKNHRLPTIPPWS